MEYTAKIYKDDFTPSKPWSADVTDVKANVTHRAAYKGFKTKKSLLDRIESALVKIEVVND